MLAVYAFVLPVYDRDHLRKSAGEKSVSKGEQGDVSGDSLSRRPACFSRINVIACGSEKKKGTYDRVGERIEDQII